MENPRYTGYAIFGRWTKHETLLDPDDVAAGHVVRFRRSTPDRIVRSRKPAHPEIISVEDFTQASCSGAPSPPAGLRTARKAERAERPVRSGFAGDRGEEGHLDAVDQAGGLSAPRFAKRISERRLAEQN